MDIYLNSVIPLNNAKNQVPGQKSKPHGIASDNRGHFYVTDLTGCVRVFNDSADYMFLFAVGRPSPKDVGTVLHNGQLSAAGISISGENVFVGFALSYIPSFLENHAELLRRPPAFTGISIHKLDGSHVFTFHTACWPYDITASDKELFVTGQKSFEIMSPALAPEWTRRQVRSLSTPEPQSKLQIQGSCLSKSKELLLTNSYSSWLGYQKFNGIYRFSTSGAYLGCITDGATSDMRGLTTTPDEDAKLLVVTSTEVRVFRWYLQEHNQRNDKEDMLPQTPLPKIEKES